MFEKYWLTRQHTHFITQSNKKTSTTEHSSVSSFTFDGFCRISRQVWEIYKKTADDHLHLCWLHPFSKILQTSKKCNKTNARMLQLYMRKRKKVFKNLLKNVEFRTSDEMEMRTRGLFPITCHFSHLNNFFLSLKVAENFS